MNRTSIPGLIAVALGIGEHDGWTGVFTRNQYEGARFRNETRIVKAAEEPGDTTPLGTLGTVLGSVGHPDLGAGYFVEWDNRPRHAVFVVEFKIAALPI